MFALYPIATRLFGWRAFFLYKPQPLLESAAGLVFQLGDPFLRHQNAGMDAVDRFLFSCGFRHCLNLRSANHTVATCPRTTAAITNDASNHPITIAHACMAM